MQTHLEKSYLDYNIRASCFKDSVGIDTISMQSINGCDSVVIQEVKYLPIEFEWSVDDVSCYQYNDGKINLINLKNANPPVQFILNDVVLNNQSGLEGLQKGNYLSLIHI